MFNKRYNQLYLNKGTCYIKDIMRYAWNIELLKAQDFKTVHDYSTQKLYYQTVIEGYCKTEDCDNIFKKRFKSIVTTQSGPYCQSCVLTKSAFERSCQPLITYDYELLKSLNIEFNKDYQNIKLYGNTTIEGKCSTKDCNELFERPFSVLVKSKNTFCKKCCEINRRDKIKQTFQKTSLFTLKTLQELGTSLLKDYSKMKIAHNTVIEGNCKTENCNGTFKKSFSTMMLHGGPYCDQCNMKNLREKMRITSLKKYGVENPFQADVVKEKIKNANLEKYGVVKASQTKEVQEKMKSTCLEKYGVEHASQLQSSKNKMRKTCLEKYGVEYNMHVPEIVEKCVKNCYRPKSYKFPSGNTVNIQGYEHLALDLLMQMKVPEDDIKVGFKNVPTIWYDFENKKRRYYTDIFITSENKCIEVKSDFTFYKEYEKNIAKQNGTKALGYKCEIWIFDKKTQLIEMIK